MANERTLQFYFVCGEDYYGQGGNDRERFEKLCKRVFKEHKEHPEIRMEIIIMEANENG